jgi:hypothetical protein
MSPERSAGDLPSLPFNLLTRPAIFNLYSFASSH